MCCFQSGLASQVLCSIPAVFAPEACLQKPRVRRTHLRNQQLALLATLGTAGLTDTLSQMVARTKLLICSTHPARSCSFSYIPHPHDPLREGVRTLTIPCSSSLSSPPHQMPQLDDFSSVRPSLSLASHLCLMFMELCSLGGDSLRRSP